MNQPEKYDGELISYVSQKPHVDSEISRNSTICNCCSVFGELTEQAERGRIRNRAARRLEFRSDRYLFQQPFDESTRGFEGCPFFSGFPCFRFFVNSLSRLPHELFMADTGVAVSPPMRTNGSCNRGIPCDRSPAFLLRRGHAQVIAICRRYGLLRFVAENNTDFLFAAVAILLPLIFETDTSLVCFRIDVWSAVEEGVVSPTNGYTVYYRLKMYRLLVT